MLYFYGFYNIKISLSIYMGISFVFPLNNIINSFKSNTILTNFFTIFLQTVLVANFYWFAHRPTTHIIFLLTSNHLLHQ